MNTARDGLQEILQTHRPQFDSAMTGLLADLRAHVKTLEQQGSADLYETNALGIFNEAHELGLQIQSFFATWTNE
jgi:hypothetical protein